jgi:hypothetical protein
LLSSGGEKVARLNILKTRSPELNVKAIRNSFDLVILEQGKVKVRQTRANYNVAPEVASKRNWIRHREALRLEVMVGITGVDERPTSGAQDQVRHI